MTVWVHWYQLTRMDLESCGLGGGTTDESGRLSRLMAH